MGRSDLGAHLRFKKPLKIFTEKLKNFETTCSPVCFVLGDVGWQLVPDEPLSHLVNGGVDGGVFVQARHQLSDDIHRYGHNTITLIVTLFAIDKMFENFEFIFEFKIAITSSLFSRFL